MSRPTPQIIKGAICYRGGFAIDADGSPKAYSLSGDGLDYLANAGHPGDWWGIVTNDYGVPVEQSEADPAPGFLISTTSLVDRTKGHRDPKRYVDSSQVPYISIAKDLLSRGIRMGDIGIVFRGEVSCGAICADVGPAHQYGEGSIALAERLGIPSNPKRGGCDTGVVWIIFPGSGGKWPRDDIEQHARDLYSTWCASGGTLGGIT